MVRGDAPEGARRVAVLTRVVARTADQQLRPLRYPDKLDAQIVRRACGPDSLQMSAELVQAQRWMPFVGIEEAQRLRKTALVGSTELQERIDEVGGE